MTGAPSAVTARASGSSDRPAQARTGPAASLGRLGLDGDEVEEIRASGDRYAMEMLDYALPTQPAHARERARV